MGSAHAQDQTMDPAAWTTTAQVDPDGAGRDSTNQTQDESMPQRSFRP